MDFLFSYNPVFCTYCGVFFFAINVLVQVHTHGIIAEPLRHQVSIWRQHANHSSQCHSLRLQQSQRSLEVGGQSKWWQQEVEPLVTWSFKTLASAPCSGELYFQDINSKLKCRISIWWQASLYTRSFWAQSPCNCMITHHETSAVEDQPVPRDLLSNSLESDVN
jgi:hypothetical protein